MEEDVTHAAIKDEQQQIYSSAKRTHTRHLISDTYLAAYYNPISKHNICRSMTYRLQSPQTILKVG